MNIIKCKSKVKASETTINDIHTIIGIKRIGKLDIVEFTELYFGVELKYYQKVFLKMLEKKKNLNLITSRRYF